MNPSEPVYIAQVSEDRRRASVFFRPILWLPHLVTVLIYAIGTVFAVLISWFALMFTGRFPGSLYRFLGGVTQYTARQTAYLCLQVDKYPAFGLGPQEGYPVQLSVPEPLAKYNRVRVFFRIFLALPVLAVQTGLSYLLLPIALLIWLVCLFKGRTSRWFHDALNLGLSFTARAQAYFLLMTEDWPSVGEPAGAPAPAAPQASYDAPMAPPPPGAPGSSD